MHGDSFGAQLHTARTELRSYETRSSQVGDELIALRASSAEYEKVVARLRLELKEARERYEKASHEVQYSSVEYANAPRRKVRMEVREYSRTREFSVLLLEQCCILSDTRRFDSD